MVGTSPLPGIKIDPIMGNANLHGARLVIFPEGTQQHGQTPD